MKIGTVKEAKNQEYRVGLTPSCVKSYVRHGHEVMVEKRAGQDAGFTDEQYAATGATLVENREAVFGSCDMVVKVKEPLEDERKLLREGMILYTYLHLAASEELTRDLLDRGVNSVAYETIQTDNGGLPCLKPMSEIAGRLSVQEGAKYLEKTFGGRGVLLGGVPGIRRGKVAIIGGGVVGTNAAKIAIGMGADVTVLDLSADRMEYLDDIFGTHVTTLYSTDTNIKEALAESDLVIGAVLLPGAKAPVLIHKEDLKQMKQGAVIVDVAVDQGGCFETTHPTTHDDPVFIVDGIVHYCVANMPGAVALSSTRALTNTTLPYGLAIADYGLEKACRRSQALTRGVNTYKGTCVCEAVAAAFGIEYRAFTDVME